MFSLNLPFCRLLKREGRKIYGNSDHRHHKFKISLTPIEEFFAKLFCRHANAHREHRQHQTEMCQVLNLFLWLKYGLIKDTAPT